jgi:hypothetical protein
VEVPNGTGDRLTPKIEARHDHHADDLQGLPEVVCAHDLVEAQTGGELAGLTGRCTERTEVQVGQEVDELVDLKRVSRLTRSRASNGQAWSTVQIGS